MESPKDLCSVWLLASAQARELRVKAADSPESWDPLHGEQGCMELISLQGLQELLGFTSGSDSVAQCFTLGWLKIATGCDMDA